MLDLFHRITVRSGISFNDLQDLQTAEFTEPSGWVIIKLDKKFGRPHRAWMIQIAIVSNHQNGRDTHVRQVKVYAPVAENTFDNRSDVSLQPKFSDSVLACYNNLR
jgi:anaphase-promoting complex subunit 10